MSFLKSLFVTKVVKGRAGPFYANKTNAERKEWFSIAADWPLVNSKIIDSIITKFGDDPMFEVFVHTSMEEGLVSQYAKMNGHGGEEINCAQIAEVLCKAGAKSLVAIGDLVKRGDISTEILARHYGNVLNTFETSIILAEKQVIAYYSLATVNGIIGKADEAKRYAREGLAQISSLRNADFHLSRVMSDVPPEILAMEVNLKELLTF